MQIIPRTLLKPLTHCSTWSLTATTRALLENLQAMMDGELNAVSGFMSGKLKVAGDMSVAMKLQTVV